MYSRWIVSFGIVLALYAPVSAEETTESYSLEELQTLARSTHPALESAQAAIEAASGTLRQTGSWSNPELSVGFGRGKPRDGGDSRSENTIELAQSIEMPGMRRRKTRSVRLDVQRAEISRAISENEIDATVSRLVVNVLYGYRHTVIALESVKVAALLLELLERRVELGESPPLEAVRARTEWFARRHDLADAEAALDLATVALNQICGGRLPDNYRIAETLEGPGAIALPDNLVQRLRRDNLHMQRTSVSIERTEAKTSIAKKERFPEFGVFAGYETELDRTASSVGVAFTIPLWNRNRGEIAATTAQHVRATAGARVVQLELESALENASAAYRRALAVIHLYQEGWSEAARESLEIATFSYRNGEGSLLEVLDAQRSLLTVNVAEARSWAELATARTEIERLIAGPLESENSNESQ